MKHAHPFLYSALLALSLATCIVSTSAQTPSPTAFGKATSLNDGWRFILADDSAAIQPSFDDSRWQRVTLPHDWGSTLPMSPDAGACQGFLHGGIGFYRCRFEAPTAEKTFIYFEGIYNRAQVFVNGRLAGSRPSGYAPQLYDITSYLNAPSADNGTSVSKDNVVAVRVDHSRENDSRWYTGSGINRPAWIISAANYRFAPWGTAWKVKSLSTKKAVVGINLELSEETPKSAKFSTIVEILDASGTVVAKHKGGLQHSLAISNPRQWTIATPYLYKIRARLMVDGRETDISEVPLGLRTFTFSPDRGFALNGQWMKVKGVCVHDDAGVLGTAVPREVWRSRLNTLKSLGVNAIRMSHNPHATIVYALCDSLGLLVMDEASDEWEFPKRKWLKGWNKGTPGFEGTFDYFEEWIDRDVADMVRRNRCHPSIFLWSIGNEVDYPNDPYSHPILDGGTGGFTQPMYGGYKPSQPNAERIGLIAQRLAKIVRSNDDSRAVTGALAGVVMSNETAYPEAVDVVGYNYTESRYAEDHARYPRRIIYGSENRHDLPAWKAVRDNDFIFGQFLWTGIDYLGESGGWPARGSEAGLLDLAGNVKPNGHYRAALWSETPVCYLGTYPLMSQGRRVGRGGRQGNIVSSYAPALWNYDDGQSIRVVCYTNASSAKLFLNGEQIGGAPTRDPQTEILYWDITYHPGTLRCEADNKAVAEIATSAQPSALRATATNQQLNDVGDVAIIEVEVVDENGRLVSLADNNITCYTEGPLRLLGLENGDARDTSDKTSNSRRAKGGRLKAYVVKTARSSSWPMAQQAAGEPRATVHFRSPLLKGTDVTL